MQGAWVGSLIRELESHKPQGMDKKKKKKQPNNTNNSINVIKFIHTIFPQDHILCVFKSTSNHINIPYSLIPPPTFNLP